MKEKELKAERKLARGTLYNLLSKLIYLSCGFMIFVVMGRLLGPNDYGIFGVVFILINFAYFFLRSGIPNSVVKYIAGDESIAYPVMKAALRVQFLWAVFLFVLFFGGAEFITSVILKDEELTTYIRIASLTIIPFALHNVYDSTLLGVRNFSKEATTLIFRSIIRVVLVVGFILLGFGIGGAIAGYFCAAVLGTLLGRSFCRFPRSNVRYSARKLVSFAIPLIISGGMVTLLLNMDSLFVKRILGHNDQIGFYFAASTTAHSLYHLFTAFGATLLPSIARSYGNNDIELTKKYIHQAVRYILIITMPIVAVVSATSRELMDLLYGNDFLPAALPLSILILGNALFALSFTLNITIVAIGRPWVAASFYLLAVLSGIACNVLLIGKYGLLGAGIAVSIAYTICLIASSTYIYIKFRTLFHWLSMCRIVFASAGIYMIAKSFPVSGIMLPLYYILLFLLYGFFVFLSGELNSEDYEVVRGVLGTKARFITRTVT